MRKTKWFEAFLDDYGIIHAYLRLDFYDGQSNAFYLKNNSEEFYPLKFQYIEENDNYRKYRLEADENLITIGNTYQIFEEHGQACLLEYGLIVRTNRFNQEFESQRTDFGAHVNARKTSFVLWAPTATAVSLKLFQADNVEYHRLNRVENGVWEITLPFDCHGLFYRYVVSVNGLINETIDPYGYGSNANNKHSCVIDFNRLNFETNRQYLPEFNSANHAVIGELSVRDFSSDLNTNIINKGKYLGLIETKRTTLDGKQVGFDYLLGLGYTHLQFMPIYDFATIDELEPNLFYNWGYDPVQYNVLEGSYSSDPNDPFSRISEFREVVSIFHEHGLRVNIDVVYNHMYDMVNSSFEKIVPYYYFRQNEAGEISNGSFCGNDVESSNLMVRKFIVDSIKHWITNYDIDGFRFDLMGILDIETIKRVVAIAKELKPDVMIYGEGWDMPTLLEPNKRATIANSAQLPEVSFFNDFYRDHVKGPTAFEGNHLAGYCLGDTSYLDAFQAALLGNASQEKVAYLFNAAQQSISYVECHDNLTLWDKINIACPSDSFQEKVDRQKLVIGTQAVSLGIMFFQLGQEACRSKDFDFNSYRSGDKVNQLNYQKLHAFSAVKAYYQDLLEFRKASKLFYENDVATYLSKVSFSALKNQALLYKINQINYLNYENVLIFFNPTKETINYELKKAGTLLYDKNGKQKIEIVNDIQLEPISMTIIAI